MLNHLKKHPVYASIPMMRPATFNKVCILGQRNVCCNCLSYLLKLKIYNLIATHVSLQYKYNMKLPRNRFCPLIAIVVAMDLNISIKIWTVAFEEYWNTATCICFFTFVYFRKLFFQNRIIRFNDKLMIISGPQNKKTP